MIFKVKEIFKLGDKGKFPQTVFVGTADQETYISKGKYSLKANNIEQLVINIDGEMLPNPTNHELRSISTQDQINLKLGQNIIRNHLTIESLNDSSY